MVDDTGIVRNREVYAFAGTETEFLATGSETSGAYALLRIAGQPGRITPTHRHDREIEVPYVLTGELVYEFEGGLAERLTPGHAALLPRNAAHRLSTQGASRTEYLLVCVPAGFEDFVRNAGERVMTGSALPPEPDAAAIARIASAAPMHGITLLPPFAPPAEYRVSPPPADRFRAGGITVDVLVPATEEGGFALIRMEMPAGVVVPLHNHVTARSFFMLDGCMEVFAHRRWNRLAPGQDLTIPPRDPHALRTLGERPAIYLAVMPASALSFMRSVASPAGAEPDAATPEEMENWLSLAESFGYRHGSREENAAIGIALRPAF